MTNCTPKDNSEELPAETVYSNSKVEFLNQKLKSLDKPVRVQFKNHVNDPKNRYYKDVQELRKLKVKLDEKSNFYIEIVIFTDETSVQAPLVATLDFYDIKTKNLIKEISYNLK